MTNSASTEVYGIIDDISATGFRFYSSFPQSIRPGQTVSGEIFLPKEPVRLHAKIKALIPGTTENESYVKAIGCSFAWDNKHEEDKLDLFLYGTDIERRINNLKETILTPLDRFTVPSFKGKRATDVRQFHWAAMVYSQNGNEQGESGVGLVSVGNGSAGARQMLVFTPLAENDHIKMNVHSRSDVSELSGTVHMSKRMDASAFSIYCYYLTPEREGSS